MISIYQYYESTTTTKIQTGPHNLLRAVLFVELEIEIEVVFVGFVVVIIRSLHDNKDNSVHEQAMCRYKRCGKHVHISVF